MDLCLGTNLEYSHVLKEDARWHWKEACQPSLRLLGWLPAWLLIKADEKTQEFLRLFFNTKGEAPIKPLARMALVAAIAMAIVFCINFAIGEEKLGAWGDFVGGVLNPVLTFLMFMGVLFTIVLQQAELSETRKEIKNSAVALTEQSKSAKKQVFEAAFFQMLSLHNEIVDSVEFQPNVRVKYKGREAIGAIFTEFFRRKYKNPQHESALKDIQDDRKMVAASYEIFWKSKKTIFGHYLRFLFNIVRFVNESEFEAKFYIRLLRAQLSNEELSLLFYNALSPQGEKFRPLIEKFALLDNLPDEGLLDPSHAAWMHESAFGEARIEAEMLSTDSKP